MLRRWWGRVLTWAYNGRKIPPGRKIALHFGLSLGGWALALIAGWALLNGLAAGLALAVWMVFGGA